MAARGYACSSIAHESLADSSSKVKELYIFDGVAHTMEMAVNGQAYKQVVQKFVKQLFWMFIFQILCVVIK